MPDRLYLFLDDIQSESVECTFINDAGVGDGKSLSWPEIAAYQAKSKLTVVVPSKFCNHVLAEVPVRNQQKARQAIPFVLEEILAQDIEGIHFAINPALYQDGKYLVSIISKHLMDEIVNTLGKHQIQAEAIIADIFGLDYQGNQASMAVGPESTLCRNQELQAAIPDNLVDRVLKQSVSEFNVHCFTDSKPSLLSQLNSHPMVKLQQNEQTFHTFLAQNLTNNPAIDLQQTTYQASHSHTKTRNLWQILGLLLSLCLLTSLGQYSVRYFMLSKQSKRLQQETMTIYQTFFPGAKRLISPKFRITRLLQGTQTPQGDKSFLRLFFKISPVIKAFETVTISQLNYRDKKMNIELTTDTVQTLQALQQKLTEKQLKVKQSSASSVGKQIKASIEVSL